MAKKEQVDLNYYINVYDLMRIDLPRPRVKRAVVTSEEWLPIIGVDVGRCQ